jgi:hypothetical protein
MTRENEALSGFFEGDLEIRVIKRFECPVCKRYHGKTKEQVVEHYTAELDWQKLHKNTQPGDKVKYVLDGKVKHISTVKNVSFGQYGFVCGCIMVITLRDGGSYYTANSINRLIPATKEEIADFS